MITKEAYATLLSFILPKEINDNFELVNVTDEPFEDCSVVNLYLEEKPVLPEGYPDAKPNGFYDASVITDFPMRDRAVVLHVKRRRWKDDDGKSLPSRQIQLVAEGTRHSREFAAFLKELLG